MPVAPTARPCFLDPEFMCREPDDEEIWEINDSYGLAAARALIDTDMSAEEIARKSMAVAAQICVFTNDQLVIEILDTE